MIGWRVIVAGAASAAALTLAGCGSGQPAAGSSSPMRAARPSVTATASPAPTPAGTPSGASGPAAVAAVSLQTSEQVAFTGEPVTVTVQASASARPGSVQWLRLASATLNLGDGASATVTGRCAGSSLPAASAGLQVRHTYRAPGAVSPQVTAARICGEQGQPDLSGSAASVRVLPTAPAASASWPQCGPSQITITTTGTGAGLGHIGVLFALRNSSSSDCRLTGYPGLLLLGSHDQVLPTTVVPAVNGAYLFPPVVPHWVALTPGASGSFDLQYGDNPVGAQANQPYATACPAAVHAEVTLPNAHDHIDVPVSMAPCGGQVIVSPVVPGTQWLTP